MYTIPHLHEPKSIWSTWKTISFNVHGREEPLPFMHHKNMRTTRNLWMNTHREYKGIIILITIFELFFPHPLYTMRVDISLLLISVCITKWGAWSYSVWPSKIILKWWIIIKSPWCFYLLILNSGFRVREGTDLESQRLSTLSNVSLVPSRY